MRCIILAVTTRGRAGWIAGAVAIVAMVWARAGMQRVPTLRVSIEPTAISANGSDAATLRIESGNARPAIRVVDNPRAAAIEDIERSGGGWQARIRAGVMPGRTTFRIEFRGGAATSVTLALTPWLTDTFGDGTPDFLRLDDESDRQSFRRWFTWLAEAQYFQAPEERPAEIDDCAALVRYAYREALRAHESGWAEMAQVPLVPALAPIGKYQYPYTPLGASLFRVRAGPFRAADLGDGAFAQFADAQTLWRWNMHAVGRDLQRALPGDLLFFRHEAGRMPFHSMIYLGESAIRRDGNRYVLYHTGPRPEEGDRGEMKRLTLTELLRYPQPEWRPQPGNPVFLGVFRWNILRKVLDDDDTRRN